MLKLASGRQQQRRLRRRRVGGKTTTVTIKLTPQGCAPKPGHDPGRARSTSPCPTRTPARFPRPSCAPLTCPRSWASRRTSRPACPAASRWISSPAPTRSTAPARRSSTGTSPSPGKAPGRPGRPTPQLAAAVQRYSGYVDQNTAGLVSHTQAFCQAIDAGNMNQAKVLYPRARVYYERIEPVAEIWGSLDTDIDGRWENPVTVASQFIGFHKIEQLIWADNTLAGAPELCAGLVNNEQQLLTLVRSAQYNPLEMASGATDLINEAATAKITRRGGALLQHRPACLPGQRRRGHGGRQPAAALPGAEGSRPAAADPAARRRGGPADDALQGQPWLRRHRLHRVLHRPGLPAPPAFGRGERPRRVACPSCPSR